MNRKEILGGGFVHYYMGDVMSGGSSTPLYFERVDASREVLSDLLFTKFSRTLPLDHSARESYAVAFSAVGSDFSVETEMITSDFLIKNEPEYTAYIGVGKARGTVDGESIIFRVMIERIYSTDYRKSVFFDPLEEIPTETVQLILWDELGNFYLADSSRVDAYSPVYASHFWGLLKSIDGTAKKVFGSDATMQTKDGQNTFVAHISDEHILHTVDVVLTKPFVTKTDEGYVEGTVTTSLKTRTIRGMGYHHLYGPN